MPPIGRLYGFLLIFALCSIALVARAINLQVVDTEYLQDQGEARYLRDVTVPTPRGNILDRNGEPLAISTPVSSVWVSPKEALQDPSRLPQLARLLGMNGSVLLKRIQAQVDTASEQNYDAILLGYGIFRFAIEFVRMPDAHIGYLAGGWLTLGMVLTLPMMAGGILLLVLAANRRNRHATVS